MSVGADERSRIDKLCSNIVIAKYGRQLQAGHNFTERSNRVEGADAEFF